MKNKLYNLILCVLVVVITGSSELSLVKASDEISENKVQDIAKDKSYKVPEAKDIDFMILKTIKLPASKFIAPKPVVQRSVHITNMTKDEIKDYICKVFGDKCNEALIIANAESGFRADAISKTNDYGVFQLNCRWQKKRIGGDCRKFLDPITNINIAKQIYNEQGWNPWTTKYLLNK